MKNKYGISIDMDWAPDIVIDYTLEILAQYNIGATLFMTNKTSCDLAGHEIAIHPNFTSLDFEKHLAERLEDFPGAKGTRSHSLFFTERLRPFYEKYGIEYQSNAMMYKEPDIRPFYMSSFTVELPFYFMDTFHIIMHEKNLKFNTDEINMESPGMKVFDFHPVHIFLNTEVLTRYESVKTFYKQPEELIKARNTKTRGTKDLFVDILKLCRQNKNECGKLIDFSAEFKNAK